MKKEVDKLEEDKDVATAALIGEVPEEGKVRRCYMLGTLKEKQTLWLK